ncbi:MAG: hypothetical protein D6814_08840 [Calditrichaeota bacterium]|nr:MAG: hypothetical protein D6814_08840 [Calditrichota bacterium]
MLRAGSPYACTEEAFRSELNQGGTLMTLGQRLMSISHRGRWLLFSDVVEFHDPGVKLLKSGKAEKNPEDEAFDNEFFRSARRTAPPSRNGSN